MARRDQSNAANRRHPEQQVAWQRANPDRWHKIQRRTYDKHRERRRAELRRYQQNQTLARYGVTQDWFRDQLVGQAGRCAICAKVFESSRDTHIDHDHESDRVRGLLCSRCNSVIGFARDSTRVLTVAIRYLEASS